MQSVTLQKKQQELVNVSAVRWRGHLKEICLTPDSKRVLTPLSSCVGKGDRLRLEKGRIYVQCHNGECQIIEPYFQRVTLSLGKEQLNAAVKEITEAREYSACRSLADYHYRGHDIFGRTSRLAFRLFHSNYPPVIGYIELATPLYMNKARSKIFDTTFRQNGIQWTSWDKETHRKYIHLFVRIARVVVSPEFRGLGIGRILIQHAQQFAHSRWQVSGYIPYFMEISADMLKYVPFVEQAGMIKVGETEGNLDRVAKDMDYLLRRFGPKKTGLAEFENSCGICDKQVSRLSGAMRVMKRQHWKKAEFLEALRSLSKKPTLKNLLLLGEVVSLPKPHYMSGLNASADRFIRRRVKEISSDEKTTKNRLTRYSLSKPIVLGNVRVAFRSKVARTQRTFSVQQAFNVSLDEFDTVVLENLSISISPGNLVLIEGPSGSGKSTLLNLLTGHAKKTEGCLVSGLTQIPSDAKIGTFAPIRSKKPMIEIFGRHSVEEGISLLGLAGLSEAFIYLKRFSELSVGQQYRAMLAKLVGSECNVWLADEFCTSLDPVSAAIVAHNVQHYARLKGATVIVAASHSTHFLSSLRPDKIIRLTSLIGHVVEEQVPSAYLDNGGNGQSQLRGFSVSPKYVDWILAKSKTMTIRRGHLNLTPGPIVLQSGKVQLEVECTAVDHKRFGDLTIEDARRDGFRSLKALKNELLQFYPDIDDTSEVTLIAFSMNTGIIARDADMKASSRGRGTGNEQH